MADDQVTRGSLIAPHQFEKANRIAHRMDLTHLIGVNGCNRDRLDLVACAAGDDEHFGLIIESMSAAMQMWGQIADLPSGNRTAYQGFVVRKRG